MELTKELLKSMGITDEQSNQIMQAHADSSDLWQTKYDALTESFNALKASDIRREKERAYHSLLREIGVADKYASAVLRVTDFDKLQLTDGKLTDPDRLKSDAKSQWGEFITTSGITGATVAQPPATTMPDLDAMSDEEFYKATIK